MSFAQNAARSGVWYAGFRFSSQIFSWLATIVIARILVPEDYGLMAMATILTGYIETFSEMGLGAAIIQKKEITDGEISSTFWSSMIIGGLFAAASYCLAYPTAWIFKEPRIIPVTQTIAILFPISALMIVPYNLLSREARFKEIGMIQLTATAVASLSMVWMAGKGFGVWTLIGGTIVLRLVTVAMSFSFARWKPAFTFNPRDVKPFLKYGANIAGARSLNYIFSKSDGFIIGRIMNAQLLGFYSFALNLASIPTDKIVSIVQQISFPVFSKYQSDPATCRIYFLKIVKYIALVLTPLIFGGAFFGRELILVILGPKWAPIIPLFRLIFIAQFIISITAINGMVHNAMGRSHWVLAFTVISAVVMPASFYVAAVHGFEYLALPWVMVYTVLCVAWTWVTLEKLEIPKVEYLRCFKSPILAVAAMILGSKLIQFLIGIGTEGIWVGNLRFLVIQEVLACVILYSVYIFKYESDTVHELWNLRKG